MDEFIWTPVDLSRSPQGSGLPRAASAGRMVNSYANTDLGILAGMDLTTERIPHL